VRDIQVALHMCETFRLLIPRYSRLELHMHVGRLLEDIMLREEVVQGILTSSAPMSLLGRDCLVVTWRVEWYGLRDGTFLVVWARRVQGGW
jgi:hypothetical protein